MGIEAAHNNHIIHRDIKPQNIIISKDGKVKVTDFGIAKAATSNTITSNVMGSVHYTSPEQARGGYSDEKSDIYSLGITMFEMLTGRVPFNGGDYGCHRHQAYSGRNAVSEGVCTGDPFQRSQYCTEMLSEVSGPQIPEYGRTDRGSEAVPDQPGGRFRGEYRSGYGRWYPDDLR